MFIIVFPYCAMVIFVFEEYIAYALKDALWYFYIFFMY